MTNSKNMHLTKRRVWGIGMDDFGVLWVWGFCGDSPMFFFCGYIWNGYVDYNPIPAAAVETTHAGCPTGRDGQTGCIGTIRQGDHHQRTSIVCLVHCCLPPSRSVRVTACLPSNATAVRPSPPADGQQAASIDAC